MRIEIHRNETSQPIKRDCTNTYTKGGMYCVYHNGAVEKWPLVSIFKVVESYDEG